MLYWDSSWLVHRFVEKVFWGEGAPMVFVATIEWTLCEQKTLWF